MGIEGMQFRHGRIVQHFDRSRPCSQQEQVASRVPTDFIHLEIELSRLFNLKGPGINYTNHIFLVPDRDIVPVWTPADIDVLSARLDLMNTLSGYKWRNGGTEKKREDINKIVGGSLVRGTGDINHRRGKTAHSLILSFCCNTHIVHPRSEQSYHNWQSQDDLDGSGPNEVDLRFLYDL